MMPTLLVTLLAQVAVFIQGDAVSESLADNLINPTAVVVHPATGVPYLCESAAGRVVRFVDNKIEPVIIGFPTEIFSTRPGYEIGPLGLHFLSNEILVVGEGGSAAGHDKISFFNVSDLSKALSHNDAAQALSLPALPGVLGEGNFHSLAATENRLFVTCHGDDLKGWIGTIDVTLPSKPSDFKRAIATFPYTNAHAPGAIAISSDGQVFVAIQGELTVRNDSVIAVFDVDGNPIAKFYTGLNDIVALAFDPKSNRLFALDFSAIEPSDSGLYEITDWNAKKQSCQVKKLVSLKNPTSMAIGKNGELYVTEIRSPQKDSINTFTGSLSRITQWK